METLLRIHTYLPLYVSSGVDFYPEQLKLYKTLIRPAVSYGAEAWTLTNKEEQAILISGRKIFRRMCGPKYGNRNGKAGRIES